MTNAIEKMGRKTRSDKKRDVKPTVHVTLYDTVSRLAYIANIPMKDVAESFCIKGIHNYQVIEKFEHKFRRSYLYNQNAYPKIFRGDPSKIGERAVKKPGSRRRITIRFEQEVHDKIAELAYALDVTVSSATSLLLQASLGNLRLLNNFLLTHANEQLDDKRKAQLKEVIRYLRRENDYHDTGFSLMDMIETIFDEIWEYGKNFKVTLEKWLDSEMEHINDK